MNILFLTSSSYSHIICLKNVIKHLVNRKETIFCMSTPENQKILEEFGAKFISYPDSIIPVSIRKEIMEQLDSAEMRSIKKDDIRKWYDIALEKDIEMLYDMTEDQVSKLEKIILDNHIDIIFRDAVDKYGEVIAKRLNMPLISYSTHNLYSLNYLNGDKERIPLFFNCIYNDINKALPENYFDDYEERALSFHEKFAQKYNTYTLPILHQFNLNQELNLILSTDFFQPKEGLNDDKKYLILYPDVAEETVNISLELKDFINKHKKVIYISSGSILGHSAIYYIKFISNLKQFGYGIVVSCFRESEILKKWVVEKGYSAFVYISDWIPQKYVLKHSVLFVTHGGNNSIMESIYNGVPMLVTPTSSEQRMNGLIIEENGMGYTMVKDRNDHISVGKMIYNLLNDNSFLDKMNYYSAKYRSHINDYSLMDGFIDEFR